MSIEDILKQPIDNIVELEKDDPIYIWLKEQGISENNEYSLFEVVRSMPLEMAKEFIRRMITAQANPGLNPKQLKKLTKVAFTR